MHRNQTPARAGIAAAILVAAIALSYSLAPVQAQSDAAEDADSAVRNAVNLVEEGRQVFRYDTFGDEQFWGETLRLHEAIAGAAHGGVGPGLSPAAALEAGLKVDAERLGEDVIAALQAGQVDLNSPATTLLLLELDAVVGVKGFFDSAGALESVGIQCALCHSTVDDSVAPGFGARRDGWANRDLNVGAVIALAPNLDPLADALETDVDSVRQVLTSWGPGKFDASLLLDGKAVRPDGRNGAVLIPPAFGLGGSNLHTFTGWGSISYWNALVANLEMGGVGRFYDPRLNNEEQFPVAVKLGSFDRRPDVDQVTSKLAALQMYQLALPVPEPVTNPFDYSAKRGEELFHGRARCSSCHTPPLYTEPGHNLHSPEELCIDSFQADRSPSGGYRTTPLAGLRTHVKGGFYHDGRFPTVRSVVEHYDACLELGLSEADIRDLTSYVSSL